MKIKELKFYLSNTDNIKHNSVYETIAFAAKRYGLSGVTVYRGIMGYGSTTVLRSDKFWEFNTKVPIIIEIVDEENKINNFLDKVLPLLKSLSKGCLVTLKDVDIILQKKGEKK